MAKLLYHRTITGTGFKYFVNSAGIIIIKRVKFEIIDEVKALRNPASESEKLVSIRADNVSLAV